MTRASPNDSKDLHWLARYCDDWRIGESRYVRLDELVTQFRMTRRTIQYWLNRLHDQGWIDWQPQRGRGRLPKLTLLRSPLESLYDLAVALIEQQKVDQALRLVPESQRAELLVKVLDQQKQHRQFDPHGHLLTQLFIPFYRAIHDLHPITATRRTEGHLLAHIHARLVEFDRNSRQIVPSLAHHWRQIPHGYRFFLRRGAKFHDGSAVTADIVKQCLLTLKHSSHVNSRQLMSVQAIEVIDPWTLDLRCHWRNELILHQLADICASIFKQTDDRKDPIGCGQFVLESRTSAQTTLTANEHYFGFRAHLDRVHIWTITDQTSLPTQPAHIVSPSSYSYAGEEHQEWQYHEVGAQLLLFNQTLRRNHLNQFRNRSALIHMLDFSYCPVASNDSLIRAYGFHHGRKTPLLEASFPNHSHTLPAQLSLLTYQLDIHIAQAKWLQQCLQNHGIELSVTVMAFPDFIRPENLKAHDLILTGEVFSEDTELSFYEFFACNTMLDVCLPKTRQQLLLKQVRNIAGRADHRQQSFMELEDTCLKDLFWFPISHTQRKVLTNKFLRGQSLNALGWLDFGTLWLDRQD